MDKFVESLKKGFSVFASGTKKLTGTAIGKTNDLIDITKLNIALSDTDKKIAEIYKKIGMTVYQKYSEGMSVTDDFADLCEKIDEFVVEQESIRAQIAELKGTNDLPKCKYRVSSKKKNDSSESQVIEITDWDDEQ